MVAPDGPAGKVTKKKGVSSDTLKPKPTEFETVTLTFVVPKTWGHTLAQRVNNWASLAEMGIDVQTKHGPIDTARWETIRYLADFEAEQFDLGEWVEIIGNEFRDSMIPDFEKGVIGQIVKTRWGWKTPFAVAIYKQAKEKDSDEVWLSTPDRPLIFYYCWHSLRRLALDEIPEEYRASARQRPPARPLTPEELAEQERLADQIINEIIAEEQAEDQ